MEDAKTYAERATVERLIKAQSGHVPVPIAIVEKPGAEPAEITDGAALWAKPKSEITAGRLHRFLPQHRRRLRRAGADHPFPRRGAAGLHVAVVRARRRGRSICSIPTARAASSSTSSASSSPTTPTSCRAICASCAGWSTCADLPLNVSREKIQESPLLAAIRKGVDQPRAVRTGTARRQGAGELTPRSGTFSAPCSRKAFTRISSAATRCSKLARFKTTAGGDEWRSLKDYVAALKTNQTAIYYLAGDDIERLKSSPHLEGFRARGIEVLLLPDPVDTFWVMPGVSFDGKPFKSVTQGAADLALIPLARCARKRTAPRRRRGGRRISWLS